MSATNFACTYPDCNKSFPRKSKLIDHINTHTQTRTYACTKCSKSYYRKYHLKRHFFIHTNETKFKCSKCGARQFEKHRLIRHEKHCSLKYPCLLCGKVYLKKADLKLHKCTKETLAKGIRTSKKRIYYVENYHLDKHDETSRDHKNIDHNFVKRKGRKRNIHTRTEIGNYMKLGALISDTYEKNTSDDRCTEYTCSKTGSYKDGSGDSELNKIDQSNINKIDELSTKNSDISKSGVVYGSNSDISKKKKTQPNVELSVDQSSTSSGLQMGTAFGQTMYFCCHCDKSYTTKKSLRTHVNAKHSGDAKFMCECGKQYQYKHKLKAHIINCNALQMSEGCKKL